MDCLPLVVRSHQGEAAVTSTQRLRSPRRKELSSKQHTTAPRLSLSGQLRAEARWGIVLALPAMLGFLIWIAGPIVASLIFSFSDWHVGGSFSFNGFENYVRMARGDRLFSKSLLVTMYYSLTSIPLTLVFAFAIAFLLNKKVIGISLFRTLLYLPSVAPSVAVAMLWLWLFDSGLRSAELYARDNRLAKATLDT